ncbi:hypothetical protein EOL70_01030 [Leucothrix sargassi]|nr:hypothetical protein EOL70_01030 [Leucothrix sargassi]
MPIIKAPTTLFDRLLKRVFDKNLKQQPKSRRLAWCSLILASLFAANTAHANCPAGYEPIGTTFNSSNYAQNTPLQSSLPLTFHDGELIFNATLNGSANWSNGVQVQNDTTFGDYLYLQPRGTPLFESSGDYVTYSFTFPNGARNITLIGAGLNNSDSNIIYPSYQGTAIPITASNFTFLDTGMVLIDADDDFEDADNNMDGATGPLSTGGTDVDTNRYELTLAGPLDQISIIAGKDELNNNNATVTQAFHSFEFCVESSEPRLTLVNDVTNDNSGTASDTDWTLTATGPTTISGVEGDAAITSAVVDAGTYTLSESGPAGYTQTSLSCTGAADTNLSDGLTLAAGEDVTCTFVNDDDLTVRTYPKPAQVCGDTYAEALITDGSGFTEAGALTEFQTRFIDHYKPVFFRTDDGDVEVYYSGAAASTATGDINTIVIPDLTTAPARDITDTSELWHITTYLAGKPGSTVNFNVEHGGNGNPQEYLTYWTEDNNGNILDFYDDTSKGWFAGWDTARGGDGEFGNISFTFPPEGFVYLTIVMVDMQARWGPIGITYECPPVLTLEKTVINDNAGVASDTDWTLTATGPTTISGVEGDASITSAVVDAGTYTLSESGPAGYSQTSLNCTGAADTDLSDGLTLAAGEDVTCTFVNDDHLPTSSLTPFACDNSFYETIGAQLSVLDVTQTPNVYAPIGSPATDFYNATGYNVNDNYIYGITNGTGWGAQDTHLVRVGADGSTEVLNVDLSSFGGPFGQGVMIGDTLYFGQGISGTINYIDVVTGISGTLSFTGTPASGSIIDWSYIEIAGDDVLVGIRNGVIYRYNLNTLAITSYSVSGLPSGGGGSSEAYGASWSTNDGLVYFSQNSSGTIYIIDGAETSSPRVIASISATESSSHDGMNCFAGGSPFIPSMTLTKSADDNTDRLVDDTITYTYTVTNTGDITINNVSISDDHSGSGTLSAIAGEAILNDSGTIGDSTDTSGNDGTWSVLAPGDSITFTATYVVTMADAMAGTDITNTATATGTPELGTLTAPKASETVTLGPLTARPPLLPASCGAWLSEGFLQGQLPLETDQTWFPSGNLNEALVYPEARIERDPATGVVSFYHTTPAITLSGFSTEDDMTGDIELNQGSEGEPGQISEVWRMTARLQGIPGTTQSFNIDTETVHEFTAFWVTDIAGNVISNGDWEYTRGEANRMYSVSVTYPADGIAYLNIAMLDPVNNHGGYSLVGYKCPVDYGDAPDSYGTTLANNGAGHTLTPTIFLGGGIADAEDNGQPSVTATNDDTVGSADEDAITSFQVLTDNASSYRVVVNATNNTGNAGRLIAWIDFDGNGTFDADEAAARVVPTDTNAASITLTWSAIPADIQQGQSYLRLRFTTDAMNAGQPTGAKTDGEVEDYAITIQSGGVNVSGRVYIDADSSASQTAGESGIGGTVVVLYDMATNTCRSIKTNGGGYYSFSAVTDGNYQLYQAHGETTPSPQQCSPAQQANPTGYQSTTTDVLSISVTGSHVVNQDFGEVAGANSAISGNTGVGIAFEPDHQSEVLPGNVAFYPHVFRTEAKGTVRFTTTAGGNATPGWSHVIYRDNNCNGTLDGSEANTSITGYNLGVEAGSKLCIIDKVYAPTNAPARDQYTVETTATFTFDGGAPSPIALTVMDITTTGEQKASVAATGGASGLELRKTVENITQGLGEIETANTAKPADVLKYRIYYRNLGVGPVTDIDIYDSIPTFTSFVSNSESCEVPPTGLICSPSRNGDDIEWEFIGELQGGTEGFVSYSVQVNQ